MYAHVIISGRVQDVGFRYFIREHANKLNLLGWVRNIHDGNVEAAFTGEITNIEKMIPLCRKGPDFAEVKDVVVEWKKAESMFKDFEIL